MIYNYFSDSLGFQCFYPSSSPPIDGFPGHQWSQADSLHVQQVFKIQISCHPINFLTFGLGGSFRVVFFVSLYTYLFVLVCISSISFYCLYFIYPFIHLSPLYPSTGPGRSGGVIVFTRALEGQWDEKDTNRCCSRVETIFQSKYCTFFLVVADGRLRLVVFFYLK